jgi:hypothetical protein
VAVDARERHEPAAARHVQGRHEGALGAQRQSVGGVLDVAADDDAAVVDERRHPDRELRVRHVGVLGDLVGTGAQGVPVDGA